MVVKIHVLMHLFLLHCSSCFYLGKTAHFVYLFKEYLPELRAQFTFHDRLIEHVKNFKKQIQNEILENVVFVGVHYRGTDFVKYLKEKSG